MEKKDIRTGMMIRVEGENRLGRYIAVDLEVLIGSDECRHNIVVRWTDGKPAALSGYKIWRATCHRFSVILKDITAIEEA